MIEPSQLLSLQYDSQPLKKVLDKIIISHNLLVEEIKHLKTANQYEEKVIFLQDSIKRLENESMKANEKIRELTEKIENQKENIINLEKEIGDYKEKLQKSVQLTDASIK